MQWSKLRRKSSWNAALSCFLPKASFGLRVLSLPAYVCVSVRPAGHVCGNHLPVRAITRDPFKLGSPNLDQICKIPWLKSLLFLGAAYLDLQGQIELKSQNLPHFELVRTITHYPLELGSPNLDQRCKIAWLRSVLLGWQLTLTFKVKFDLKSRIFWLTTNGNT